MKFGRKLLLVSALTLPLIAAEATQAKAPERRGNEDVREIVIFGDEATKAEATQAPKPALSEEKIMLVHEAMMKAGLADRPIHEKLIRLNGELQTIMEAPKFNKKAFVRKSYEQANLRAQLEKHRATALASVASKFSPEERKALTEIMPPFFMGGMPMHPTRGMMAPAPQERPCKDCAKMKRQAKRRPVVIPVQPKDKDTDELMIK